MRGLPLPDAARLISLLARLALVPIVGALVIAGIVRVLFFRTTFRPWFYYFLMIFNLLLGCFVLLTAAYGLIRELGFMGR